jgi:hypothetical protein
MYFVIFKKADNQNQNELQPITKSQNIDESISYNRPFGGIIDVNVLVVIPSDSKSSRLNYSLRTFLIIQGFSIYLFYFQI